MSKHFFKLQTRNLTMIKDRVNDADNLCPDLKNFKTFFVLWTILKTAWWNIHFCLVNSFYGDFQWILKNNTRTRQQKNIPRRIWILEWETKIATISKNLDEPLTSYESPLRQCMAMKGADAWYISDIICNILSLTDIPARRKPKNFSQRLFQSSRATRSYPSKRHRY